MREVAFDDLARLPVVQYYEAAFRKATGVSLKVIPPADACPRRQFGPEDNAFCRLAAVTPAGCAACLETETRAQRSVAKRVVLQQVHCYAGLTVVAVPVLSGGRHLATVVSGQVFRREPTQRDFAMVVKMLGDGVNEDWEKKARKAYFETPVVTADRFQAVIQLLNVFAQYLADLGGRQAIACSEVEPEAVASAKQFVQSHAEEPIKLERVVQHVNVSRFYFCKLFKKATGLNFTDYLSRIRIERARNLLLNPDLRVSEIAFEVGFQSLTHFNRVFKHTVGQSPTQYREQLTGR